MQRQMTEGIRRGESGPRIGAFFDLDRTLLEGFSVFAFMQQRLMTGTMPPRELQANIAAFANYALGKTGLSGVMTTTTRALNGVAEQSFEELGQAAFRQQLASRIYPEARALVKAHQDQGHTVAIISSATRYQIEPVARELGIDLVMCTRLEVKNGVFTGEIVPPACWKEGKSLAAQQLAKQHKLSLAGSYFYTDAMEDLPLLELVGHPHALNPDRELAAVAEQRGWPVHRFAKRKTGLNEVIRTGLAYGGMLPAVAAGLPARWLTGSARQAANVTIAGWADFATTAIGIDIRVIGREHLWSHRPAVFVFNHQSAADAIIVPRLLRHDFTGVAKIEASRAPFTGQMLKAVGTVFIDRADRAQALDALAPAVEALRNGTSIAIAPEGTRSETTALLPFKKGAFHMAMQAGVPVVPIVIHNARDVQPKGERVFRAATVYVEVLPPVDTKRWKAATMNKHVAAVRDMFLKTLSKRHSDSEPGTSRARKAVATPAPAPAAKKTTRKRGSRK